MILWILFDLAVIVALVGYFFGPRAAVWLGVSLFFVLAFLFSVAIIAASLFVAWFFFGFGAWFWSVAILMGAIFFKTWAWELWLRDWLEHRRVTRKIQLP